MVGEGGRSEKKKKKGQREKKRFFLEDHETTVVAIGITLSPLSSESLDIETYSSLMLDHPHHLRLLGRTVAPSERKRKVI